METQEYREIVQATFQSFPDFGASHATFQVIEAFALAITKEVSTHPHPEDIALQVAHDVVGLSNNQFLQQATFVEDSDTEGGFAHVVIGCTFTGPDGEEDQDCMERAFWVSEQCTQEEIEEWIELLAYVTGENLCFVTLLDFVKTPKVIDNPFYGKL